MRTLSTHRKSGPVIAYETASGDVTITIQKTRFPTEKTDGAATWKAGDIAPRCYDFRGIDKADVKIGNACVGAEPTYGGISRDNPKKEYNENCTVPRQ